MRLPLFRLVLYLEFDLLTALFMMYYDKHGLSHLWPLRNEENLFNIHDFDKDKKFSLKQNLEKTNAA